MTKELYVSSTPHETKVGLVEDDQLAEIYLERENEYTLAGSIYKGRVTRVLPGMQSAFVDIGLERDAFLYVSDFMELEDPDEIEEIPTNGRPVAQPFEIQPRAEAQPVVIEGGAGEEASSPEEPSETASPNGEGSGNGEQHEGRGNWRNRRRRRGRRGERMPESKYARPAEGREPRNERDSRDSRNGDREEYGPPAGYEPIILPGESISKYQRMTPRAAEAKERVSSSDKATEAMSPVAKSFPEDEPLFASPVEQSLAEPIEAHEDATGAHEEEDQAETYEEVERAPSEASPWDDEQQRLHRMNVAAVFGAEEEKGAEAEPAAEEAKTAAEEPAAASASAGTLEHEEIEEDEADISEYVEELEMDAAFDEVEEETHEAEEFHPAVHEIAASGEPPAEMVEPLAAEPVAGAEGAELTNGDEPVDEAAEEEAELEEAQAEAEALLEAEARGNGTVDARVEVRAPAATAAYTQRTARPGYERRGGGGPRGRRGGRRFSRRREPQNVPLISDLLKEGQEILVQIAKEPIGKKGARITSHIALPGRFLVYMPTVNHTGVSRKISSEEERQRLKRIVISERENGHGGFIVRTAAQNATEEELRADIRFLKGLWSEIKGRSESGKAPSLIYHDLNVVERVLRDQVTSDFSAIWVDNEQEYERILRFANRFQPALVKRVKLYSKETPLFDQFGLSDEINKALKSKVWLKSGGYIVINQTEALVAIDVNTGKYVGKTARLEDTIVKTNVDAIKEIVRQVRLRDLGGIIVIDFIDMDERRNRQKVMQALEEALRADRAPSKVLQFNDFGLVAITRKRVKQSLERTIGSPCPYCEATGFVKSVGTICNEIYVEMRKISTHLEHSDVMLRVNPDVAKALKSNNGTMLNEMEELTKRTVIVKSDPALHQEKFDIN